MLEGIGRVGAYVQQKNLKTAAKYRIKTGQSLIPSKTDRLQSALKQINQSHSSQSSDSIKTTTIKSKLKGGRKLTADEMNYLKEKDPDLYRKAKGAQKAREELEQDLARCHTKQEARQAVMRAQLKASGEAMADLTAAKGGGMAGGFGGANAASFDGGIGDISDISATAGEAGPADPHGENINAMPAASIDASTPTEGGIAGEEAQAAASDKAEVKEMLSNILQDINSALSELTRAGESPQDADDTPAEGNQASTEAAAQAANGPGTANNSGKAAVDDIIEKFIYKIRAIQNAWDEFTHSKEYREMPEGYGPNDGGKARTSANDAAIMDIINLYSASTDEVVLPVSGSLDILQ